MSYRGKRKTSNSLLRRAKSVQARRSGHAKAIDSNLKAPKARSVTQWLTAPNRYDLPTVDTNKPQVKSMEITDGKYIFEHQSEFDRLVNKDDIDTRIPENKKIYLKILETLDENKIPYYTDPQLRKTDGMPDVSIEVLFKDLAKAEKLTNNLYKALKRTF